LGGGAVNTPRETFEIAKILSGFTCRSVCVKDIHGPGGNRWTELTDNGLAQIPLLAKGNGKTVKTCKLKKNSGDTSLRGELRRIGEEEADFQPERSVPGDGGIDKTQNFNKAAKSNRPSLKNFLITWGTMGSDKN